MTLFSATEWSNTRLVKECIRGNEQDNELRGGGGDDLLIDWSGDGADADIFDGGEGFDIVSYEAGGAVTVDLSNNGLNAGDATGDTYVSVEGVIGSTS